MSSDYEALRAVAEGAQSPMTCGGHRSTGSLLACDECRSRANSHSELTRAASPDVVLALLDEVAALRGALARRESDVAVLHRDTLAAEAKVARVEAALDDLEADWGSKIGVVPLGDVSSVRAALVARDNAN